MKEERIVKKAYDGIENLTPEEYATISRLADNLDLKHDLPLKEVARRILEQRKE